jgi:hypothetical protein
MTITGDVFKQLQKRLSDPLLTALTVLLVILDKVFDGFLPIF